MKELTILDLHRVVHLVGGYSSDKCKRLKIMLTNPDVYIYTNEEETALAYYARINRYILEAHVESSLKCRGYKLKKFLVDAGYMAVEHDDDITSVVNFVDVDDKKLLLFSGTFAERVGVIGDKVMFKTERYS